MNECIYAVFPDAALFSLGTSDGWGGCDQEDTSSRILGNEQAGSAGLFARYEDSCLAGPDLIRTLRLYRHTHETRKLSKTFLQPTGSEISEISIGSLFAGSSMVNGHPFPAEKVGVSGSIVITTLLE